MDSENFSKYVYMYILIQSGYIYEREGKRNDSQIRVALPPNDTHKQALHTDLVNTHIKW